MKLESILSERIITEKINKAYDNDRLEEKDFHNDRYSHEKLLLEDFTAGQGPHSGLGSAQGGGGCFLIETSVEFLLFN